MYRSRECIVQQVTNDRASIAHIFFTSTTIRKVCVSHSQPWPSPAKLNLFLHITGRRSDGYHELQSAFQLIEFSDTLFFSARGDGEIELQCDDPSLAVPDNLVCRAAQALRQKTGCKQGVSIHLQKKIPMGAGLGGGSSNAATTLLALNKLWQLGFSGAELEQIGLTLGADVPVFVRGVSAWAEGIGEILQPLQLPQRWFVVLNPAIHITTAELFNDRQLTRDCSPITIRGFQDGEPTQNVFEAVVRKRHTEVDFALVSLSEVAAALNLEGQNSHALDCQEPDVQELCLGPRMTGTGSSVFLACESEAMARKVLTGVYKRYRNGSTITESSATHFSFDEGSGKSSSKGSSKSSGKGISGFVTRGIQQSPLIAALGGL